MHLLDFYKDESKHDELKQLFMLGSQKHRSGLPANFLEKDIWVTEILRLLYDEKLIGDLPVAFKGGTALSKCWRTIDRFSEDIDLSIHWSALADEDKEEVAWENSTKNGSQKKKFNRRQKTLLTEWSTNLVDELNKRFLDYDIPDLKAKLDADSRGANINVHFPRITAGSGDYQLDYVLLEF